MTFNVSGVEHRVPHSDDKNDVFVRIVGTTYETDLFEFLDAISFGERGWDNDIQDWITGRRPPFWGNVRWDAVGVGVALIGLLLASVLGCGTT